MSNRPCWYNCYTSEDAAEAAFYYHTEAKGERADAMEIIYHDVCGSWHIVKVHRSLEFAAWQLAHRTGCPYLSGDGCACRLYANPDHAHERPTVRPTAT